MGQVVAGANCFASIIGAAVAVNGSIGDLRPPPVRLLSLAQAAPPPDLPPTFSDGDAAQVGVGRMVPTPAAGAELGGRCWDHPACLEGFACPPSLQTKLVHHVGASHVAEDKPVTGLPL